MDISNNKLSSDILYGINYGLVDDGIGKTTEFNNFMAACKALSKKGELPGGTILLNSKPNNIDFAWILDGKNTRLRRNYSETGTTQGCFHVTASGGKFRNFGIDASSGTTGGTLVSVISTSGVSLSDLVFENMTNSTFGTNTHKYTFYIDGGSDSTKPMNDIALRNVLNYGGELFSTRVKSVQEFSWIGGGCYGAGGSNVNSGSFDFTGEAGNKSYYTRIDLTSITGCLFLTQCEWGVVVLTSAGTNGTASVANDSTCVSFKAIIAKSAATLQTLWTTSYYL